MRFQNILELKKPRQRSITRLGFLFVGVILIALASVWVPKPPDGTDRIYMSALLLDRASDLYPLTIQNVMWLVFCIGLAEVRLRFRRATIELRQLNKGLLPVDPAVILRSKDLIPIYRRLTRQQSQKNFRLQRIVLRAIQQFQISRSVNQANSLVNSSIELLQHEIDLKFSTLRYIVWFIPTLGLSVQ